MLRRTDRDRPSRCSAAAVSVVAALLLAFGAGPAAAAPPAPTVPGATTTTVAPIPPKAWALVDADTGVVVDAMNDHVPLPPASLTKIVTALVAVAAVPDTSNVIIGPRAAAQPANKVGALAGQSWPEDELLHVLLMESANDLAMAVAEHVTGTPEAFGPVMTATGIGLGMADNPSFHDPAGLDDEHSVGGGNLVSARDLAIAARALLADPVLGPIVATPTYAYTDPTGMARMAKNHNKLLFGQYPGAIGMKTGFTKAAGRTFIGAATRNGRTMIAVVLGAPDTYGWSTRLLDEGFATPVAAEAGHDRLPAVRRPTAVLPGASVATNVSPAAPTAPAVTTAAAVDVPTTALADPSVDVEDVPAEVAAPAVVPAAPPVAPAVAAVAVADPERGTTQGRILAGAALTLVALAVARSAVAARRRRRRPLWHR